MRTPTGAFQGWALALAVASLAACGPAPTPGATVDGDGDGAAPIQGSLQIPRLGAPQTLEVAGWNIQWFGNAGRGPQDEQLQLENVRDVIRGADIDVWLVQEIVSLEHFEKLLKALPDYEGFLSNDARVQDGATYYNAGEQKVGIIYKRSELTVRSARVVLGEAALDFGGRPPLEISVTAQVNGAAVDWTMLVLHMKAGVDLDALERRTSGSKALKTYLDASHANDQVMVVGDWNDDLDVSQVEGRPTPFANFVSDRTRYLFATRPLTDAHQSSTVALKRMLDHHLLSRSGGAQMAGPTQVFRLDESIPLYSRTTSDHFPVVTRFGPKEPASGGVFINEVLANEPGELSSGEFVELVNAGETPADLSGWTISDSVAVRHQFAAGTKLPGGSALVVFAGPSAFDLRTTRAVAASSGRLALLNAGEQVTLADGTGKAIDTFRYNASLASVDGVSANRGADGLAHSALVLHTARSNESASPGVRVDGSPFGTIDPSFLSEEAEPNTTSTQANGSVGLGQDVRGEVGGADGEDWFRVALPAGRFQVTVGLAAGAEVQVAVYEEGNLRTPVLGTGGGLNPRRGGFSTTRAGNYLVKLTGKGRYALGLDVER